MFAGAPRGDHKLFGRIVTKEILARTVDSPQERISERTREKVVDVLDVKEILESIMDISQERISERTAGRNLDVPEHVVKDIFEETGDGATFSSRALATVSWERSVSMCHFRMS